MEENCWGKDDSRKEKSFLELKSEINVLWRNYWREIFFREAFSWWIWRWSEIDGQLRKTKSKLGGVCWFFIYEKILVCWLEGFARRLGLKSFLNEILQSRRYFSLFLLKFHSKFEQMWLFANFCFSQILPTRSNSPVISLSNYECFLFH